MEKYTDIHDERHTDTKTNSIDVPHPKSSTDLLTDRNINRPKDTSRNIQAQAEIDRNKQTQTGTERQEGRHRQTYTRSGTYKRLVIIGTIFQIKSIMLANIIITFYNAIQ